VQAHAGPGALFPVAQRRIEYHYMIRLFHLSIPFLSIDSLLGDAGNKTPAKLGFGGLSGEPTAPGTPSNATPAARQDTGVAAQREKGQVVDGRNLHDVEKLPLPTGTCQERQTGKHHFRPSLHIHSL
jgi:hypothetical protein